MKIFIFAIVPIVLLSTNSFAQDKKSIECHYDADPKSLISLSIDEVGGGSETVLLGVNMNESSGFTKSALLPSGALAKQIDDGMVLISFGADADPNASEVYDGALFAVKRQGATNSYRGYMSVQDDGIAVMSITCEVN